MAKDFWFAFEPKVWLTDPELRACSKRARATWIDILCVMHSCEVKGVLRTGTRAWSLKEIAASVSGNTAENLEDIAELLTKGAASKEDGTGALLCRMMHNRWKLSNTRRTTGSMGGNPSLVNQTVNQNPTKGPTKPLTLVSDYSSDLKPEGVQGGIPRATGPPPSTAVNLPESMVVLLRAWQRSDYVNSTQMDLMAALVNDYDLETVRNAMQTHIESGPQDAVGKWPYLRGICRRMVSKGEKPGAKSAAQQAAEIEARKKARRDRAGVQ